MITVIDTKTLKVVETIHENFSAGRIESMADGRMIVPEGAPGHRLHIYTGCISMTVHRIRE